MNVWSDAEDLWPSRLQAAAKLVLPGESVLDVGAGAQGLARYLHPSCAYTPADQHQRTPDTMLIDLEQPQTIIATEAFDVVALLGVIEYLTDPLSALQKLRDFGRYMVVSYAPFIPGPRGSPHRRRANNWINSLTRDELEALFVRAGLDVEADIPWQAQLIYRLSA